MHIIFFGPPGSGKGTQANLISNKYNIANISTGVILRQYVSNIPNSHLSKINIINSVNIGSLVNDEFILQLINTRINKADCCNGFLLDGFPRTMVQALALKKNKIFIDFVIQFIVPDSVIISRLSGRRIHMSSGRTYHTKFNPPKSKNLDDITGEMLTSRKDDHEDVVRKRLQIYYQYTKPIINYYQKEMKKGNTKFFSIDGDRTISKIYKDLTDIFN